MLVLARGLGESLVIGEPPNETTVTVLEIDRGRIRLGLKANLSIPIWRQELTASSAPPAGSPPCAADLAASESPATSFTVSQETKSAVSTKS